MKRTAKAHWSGTLKKGKGDLTTQSNVLDKINYSFKTRFEENEKGTNPEELLAVAHAGCFTMSVASKLTQKGFSLISLDTEVTVVLENSSILSSHLSITGSVAGITSEEFDELTKDAAKNCIISKALSIPISIEAHLVLEKQKTLKPLV